MPRYDYILMDAGMTLFDPPNTADSYREALEILLVEKPDHL